MNATPQTAVDDEIQRRLSKLSAYKQTEYHCVEAIAALRQLLREVLELEGHASGSNGDGPSDSGGRAELAKAHHAVRRAHQQLNKLAKEAQRASRREGGEYEADLKELLRHVESAKRWYRECFRVGPAGGAAYQPQSDVGSALDDEGQYTRSPMRSGATDLTTPLLAVSSDGRSRGAGSWCADACAPRPTVSDEEFLVFADEVRRNDDLAEAALDRISHGLSRLHENALSVTSELQTQRQLLDDVEGKVDTTHTKLSRMNIRLRKILSDKGRCDWFMYAFCCVLLLGVIVAIAVLIKS
ncbi:putative Qb-SNARE protein [Trypanosoma rangeli]|uniref:Putative Qb-SNARE protein n=1 Tax=Trypanosoma rangeli TaxID=5698 RepID=A0A422NZG0_TRYRA|nr:putative Qb-SNARE protein [Trypanosoma rangeli]RNF10825.1 putative Qb-SNARE protein [Trypanosoma rangeli]|eukprot:RNF10825.1 putative Qb-SNARE protein [Trypanosoma rangeli]